MAGCPQTSLMRNLKLPVALGCWSQLPSFYLQMLQLPQHETWLPT